MTDDGDASIKSVEEKGSEKSVDINIKKESVTVKKEDVKCMLCTKQAAEVIDLNTRTNAGTLLHECIGEYTQVVFTSENVTKQICKNCFDLIDVLEQTESKYLKLKMTFEAIINKNLLFDPHLLSIDVVKSETKLATNHGTDSKDEPLSLAKKRRISEPVAENNDTHLNKKKTIKKRKLNDESWECKECDATGEKDGQMALVSHMLGKHMAPIQVDVTKIENNDKNNENDFEDISNVDDDFDNDEDYIPEEIEEKPDSKGSGRKNGARNKPKPKKYFYCDNCPSKFTSPDNMDRKKRKCYSDAQVAEALSSIRQGMSIYKASRQYNVPETSLRSKRDALYENEHCGKQPVLNLNEERQIVDWIYYLDKCGFPVTKDLLLHTASKLVENLQRPNPFKDGVPGKKWFLGFMQRHPAVSQLVSQNLPTSRNQVTEVALRAWFNRVGSYFKENNLLQVLQDPKRIFNCDETGFFLCPKDKQVLVRKGSKRVYNRVANDEKECLTILVNVSADGDVAPPMILFPYKRLPNNIKSTVPSWWGLGNTESGWMNMESFYEYVANVFYPWLLQQEITLPVVLFLDGHSSHISLPLTTFCKEKGIVLVALLPNSTHVLHPLDVAVFRPVKGTWRDIVREFKVKHNYAKLKRTDFSREVQKCFDRSLKPKTIMSGFKCCGLYPFDEQNIDYDKLLSKVKKHQDKLSKANQNIPLDTQQMSNIESSEQFKKQFEIRLSRDTLKSFKEAGNQWTSDPTYEKLFLFWKSYII